MALEGATDQEDKIHKKYLVETQWKDIALGSPFLIAQSSLE